MWASRKDWGVMGGDAHKARGFTKTTALYSMVSCLSIMVQAGDSKGGQRGKGTDSSPSRLGKTGPLFEF